MLALFRRRFVLLLAALVLLAAAGGCAWLDQKQGALIFNPVQGEWRGYRGLPEGFREEWIAVGNGGDKLHAWWAPHEDANAPVLLYLHGARWNLTGSVTRIPRWNKMGFSVLAIDYRGFGRSVTADATAPTERSAGEDAEAAWAHLRRLAPNSRAFIFGHSLGGSIATALAVRHPEADGLILEGAFTSIPEMIRETRWGFLPVAFLVTQRFATVDNIDAVKMPVLIVHGTADDIVPYAMGEKLFAAAKAPKRFFRADGGSHHNLTSSFFDDYRRTVAEFFQLPGDHAARAAQTSQAGSMPTGTATR